MQAAKAVSTPSRVFHLDPLEFESITRGKPPEKVAAFYLALAELGRVQRQQFELLVEAGIAALDVLDGDADNEPSLGFLEQRDQTFISAGYDGGADLEFQCEDEGVDTDREPEEAF